MRGSWGAMSIFAAALFAVPVAAADTAASPLPLIGTTQSRPLCTAVRQTVAPAVAELMRVDGGILASRKMLLDLARNAGDPQTNLKLEGDKAKDMQRLRLAALARGMTQDLSLVTHALASLPPPSTASADDRLVQDLHARLAAVASRQQDAVNELNGLVETELQGQMRTEFDSTLGPPLLNGDRNPPLPSALVGSGLQMKDPLPMFDRRHQVSSDTLLGHTLYDHVANDVAEHQSVIATAERLAAPTIESAAHACGAPTANP